MADDADGNRPKRRCVSTRTKGKGVPSAVHYVGYVEDEETPEMIMKKFEELEKVMKVMNAPQPERDAENQPLEDEGIEGDDRSRSHAEASTSQRVLNEEQLMHVFRQTSVFNVKTLMQNNDVLMACDRNAMGDERGSWSADDSLSSDEDDGWEYLRGFWSDEDLTSAAARRKHRKRGSNHGERPVRQRVPPTQRPRHAVVTQFNRDTNAFIRRKVKIVDKDALVQLRIPAPPIPPSWGRVVKPYQPSRPQPDGPAMPLADRSQYHRCSDITKFDFSKLTKKYQALLINPGWDEPEPTGSTAGRSCGSAGAGSAASSSVCRLSSLPLTRLCPIGFIFIWAEKQQISPICRHMASKGYSYIENLTWVFLAPTNAVLTLPHALSRRSHITLLIFRRDVEEGRAIELRHQRSPDVIFDCIRHAEGTRWQVPEEALSSIETMLPMGRGIFLQLWAAKGSHRAGWDHLAELRGC